MTARAPESPLVRPLRSFRPWPVGRRFAFEEKRGRVYLHCCKDGTCSLRRPSESVFNGAALPVYIAPTMDAAIALQVLMCFRVHSPHPDMKPGAEWYKFNDVKTSPHIGRSLPPWEGMPFPVFAVEDMPYLTAKIHACFERHIAPRRSS